MADANVTFDLLHWAKATPHAPALISPNLRLTYGQLDSLTWKCARFLHDQGVRAGDVVALTFVSDAALAVALQAVARLGAAGISLPRSAGAVERKVVATEAGARCLVTDSPAAFDAGLPPVPLDLRQISRNPHSVRAGILAECPTAPWQIIQGSGSTGAPKLLPVSHGQARSRFAAQIRASSIRPEDCLASLSGLEYSISKHRHGWAMAAGSAYAVLAAREIDPLALLRPLGVTLLGASVVHAESMLRNLRPVDLELLATLRALSLAGSVVGPDLRARLRARIGDRLWVDYGSNEAGHLAIAMPPEVFESPGTVGRILPGVELQIVDAEDRPAEPGATGQVRVRGPGVITGYRNDAEATARHFRDGWFYPGDLGRMTADGQLIHLGRADRTMIFDGINIAPGEIESVLASHPAVRDAVAMPLRSAAHQQIPICAVALHEGQRASEQQLLGYAQERLGLRSPRRVAILDAIPRNDAGKLMPADLAEMVRRHLDPGRAAH
jgi:acyl-coenzyme A synthetase/AMP-(fatty) acid ligase